MGARQQNSRLVSRARLPNLPPDARARVQAAELCAIEGLIKDLRAACNQFIEASRDLAKAEHSRLAEIKIAWWHNNNNCGENPMKSDFIAPKDVAQLKGWTLKYVYDLLAAGRIHGARKVGKQWCIPARALPVLDETRRRPAVQR